MFTFSPMNSYHQRLSSEDRSSSGFVHTLLSRQPFLKLGNCLLSDHLLISLARQQGRWEELLSAEQTTYALGQVIALQALPAIDEVEDGSALLDYRVRLRDCLDDCIVDELAFVLVSLSDDQHWKHIETSVFACVIYDRVAACIDLTPRAETLYLRWAGDRIEALAEAHFNTEIPLSLIGLQEVLYERLDALLFDVRTRLLARLIE